MRFLSLHLENWRNFSNIDLCLQKRTFVIGPNAAGKSNFLDAFRFLRDIASIGGGLQKAVAGRGGISKLRCLSARRHSSIVLQMSLGDEIDQPEWYYKIELSQDNNRRPILKAEIVKHKGNTILERPNQDDSSDSERLTQTHLEQVNSNKNFRDIADFLNSIRYLHIVPQLIREPDRSVGKINDPYGGDFLEQIARKSKKIWESRLGKITQALRVAVPQLKELKLERDSTTGTPHLEGLYEHWRPNAGWQREDQFSDGTLRLLGLLWAVLDGAGPLLLEEPELSLHPEVVSRIPQMLARLSRKAGRQIIVSSHSSNFLQDPGIAPDEVFLLFPEIGGTRIVCGKDDKEINEVIKGGLTMAEATLPRTAPKNAAQLSLFGDD